MRTLICLVALLLTLACQPATPPEAVQPTEPDTNASALRELTLSAPDGVPIVADIRGSGDTTLVFVHCWACNRSFWENQLDAFADRYQVVSFDLPGHGASGRNRATWSIAAYGADVAAVVEQLDLERVILIGHSMGGPVSLYAAQLLPQRVIGIVCADTLHNVEQEIPAEQLEQFATAFEQDFSGTMASLISGAFFPSEADPAVVELVTSRASAADPTVTVALLRDFANLDLANAMEQVTVPIRAINKTPNTEQDPVTAVEVNQRHGDFEVVLMEGVGHFLQLEQPEQFNQLLTKVLEEMTGDR